MNGLEMKIGELLSTTRSIAKDVCELKNDHKGLISFQSRTEERLKHGSTTLQDHEARIDEVEGRPKSPRAWLTYTLITVGFVVLALLVSIAGGGS